MMKDIDAVELTEEQIEDIEKLSLRLALQGLFWFAPQALDYFERSPDKAQDVAEDITREAMAAFAGFPIRVRLMGTIDYKQARWLPTTYGLVPQALMVDSKAKKDDDGHRLDLQMSQVSMIVHRAGGQPPLKPRLTPVVTIPFEDNQVKRAITTVISVQYTYTDLEQSIRSSAISPMGFPTNYLSPNHIANESCALYSWSRGGRP